MTTETPIAPEPTPNTPAQPKPKKHWKAPTVAAAIALFAGIGMGGTGGVSQADYDAAQANLASVTSERDTASARVEELTANAEVEAAKLKEAQEAAELAKADVENAKADIEKERSSLEEQQLALEKREKAVSGEEKKAKENTFGPGRWVVGEDIKAGTYKTTEPVTSDRCYWAITRSGSNGDDIHSNDFGTQGNHTVTLKKGQDFESTECGSWKLSS